LIVSPSTLKPSQAGALREPVVGAAAPTPAVALLSGVVELELAEPPSHPTRAPLMIAASASMLRLLPPIFTWFHLWLPSGPGVFGVRQVYRKLHRNIFGVRTNFKK